MVHNIEGVIFQGWCLSNYICKW